VRIAGANTDIYKRFWNEDRYSRPTAPKPEESGRDVWSTCSGHRFCRWT
jgi:hypothetical protein